jgi:SPP1 gp7 family putative phage head morphogenesis protein
MALKQGIKDQIKRRQNEMKTRTRRRRPDKWLFPTSVEREYQKILKKYVDVYISGVKQFIIPQLENLVVEAQGYRPDSVRQDDWPDKIAAMVASVQVYFENNAPKPEVFVPIIAADINGFNEKEFKKVMKSVLQVDVFVAEPWLKVETSSFVRENVALVKSIESMSLTQVEGIVQRGVRAGTRAELISQQIEEQLGVAGRRADIIARDQVGKFNGQLTELRQTELGIERFIWRTSNDEKVRPEHAELEGEVFEWRNLPSEGMPGEQVMCRCFAEPVLDDILD